MSACGSLQHIFENPLPENPTLLESLSWNQIKPVKSIDHSSSSFTEIFGELHFKETPESSSLPSSSSSRLCSSSFSEVENEVPLSCNINQTPASSSSPYVSTTPTTKSHKSSDSFSSLSSESLQLCTEGLGFESSDDVEELNEWWQTQKEASKTHLASEDSSHRECKSRSRVNGVEYPPPISCIGRSGKPWISFKSYRKDGRFVLKEIRVPTHDVLHAHREDGRLKLHFVQSDDEEFPEQEDEEVDDDNQGEEEDYHDSVENTDDGEENMVKENDESVTYQVNEEERD